MRESSSDVKNFLRNNLRKIIADETAIGFSWQGTERKTKVKVLNTIHALMSNVIQIIKLTQTFNILDGFQMQHMKNLIKYLLV